jgi:hypothetical protein
MKKLLTIAALLGAVTTMSYGQGQINFSAGSAANTRMSTNSTPGGPTTGQTGLNSQGYTYYYALFVANSTLTNVTSGLDPTRTAGWSLATWDASNTSGQAAGSGIYATNSNSLGRMTGNPNTDDVFVAGRANGSSASFMVVGWSSQVAGASWSQAEAFIDTYLDTGSAPTTGWIGNSAIATSVQPGGGATPLGNIFGGNAGQVLGFTLNMVTPVPEPGTFALVGLGAATLLIFRRRKN